MVLLFRKLVLACVEVLHGHTGVEWWVRKDFATLVLSLVSLEVHVLHDLLVFTTDALVDHLGRVRLQSLLDQVLVLREWNDCGSPLDIHLAATGLHLLVRPRVTAFLL